MPFPIAKGKDKFVGKKNIDDPLNVKAPRYEGEVPGEAPEPEPEVRTMPGYQVRVHEEQADLAAKMHALKAFVDNDLVMECTDIQQRLLKRQLHAMQAYKEVLDLRIMDFKNG